MQRNPRNENIIFLILRNNDILKVSRAAWTAVMEDKMILWIYAIKPTQVAEELLKIAIEDKFKGGEE